MDKRACAILKVVRTFTRRIYARRKLLKLKNGRPFAKPLTLHEDGRIDGYCRFLRSAQIFFMRSEWAFFCAAVRRRRPRFLGCCESESAVAAALGLPLPRACNSAISASIRLRCACSPAIANS